MERLLADAEKLTGVKYDINNLADVYSAIHAVQTEIGITGTTAKEAEKTISGSLSRVKAAWKNLLVGISTGENLDELFDNLVESAEIAFQNILPVAMKTLQSLPRMVRRVAPLLSKEIPKIIRELLPALVSAAKELIVSLAESLPELLNAVFDVLPDIISAVIEIAGAVFDGLVEAIPELLTRVWDAIDEAIEKSDFAPTWDRIKESASKAFEEISQYTDTLSEPFANMSESFGTLKDDIDEIVKKIKEWEEEHHVIETVFDQVSKTMKGGILLLGFAFDGLAWVLDRIHDGINGIKTVFEAAKTAGAEAADWIVTKWNEVKDAVQEVVGALNPLGTIVGWLGGGASGSGARSSGRTGSWAIGNDFVPYDNYPAMLHRGEAVLTAREADEWRRGEGHGRQIVNNFTFNGVSQSDLDYIVAYVNRGLG